MKDAGIYIFPSEKKKKNFFTEVSLLGVYPSKTVLICESVLQSDPGRGVRRELGLCSSWDFAAAAVAAAEQQSTKAVLSVNTSSPFPKPFRSQVALPVAEHSPQHYGFV